jgi:hypothetical protein
MGMLRSEFSVEAGLEEARGALNVEVISLTPPCIIISSVILYAKYTGRCQLQRPRLGEGDAEAAT